MVRGIGFLVNKASDNGGCKPENTNNILILRIVILGSALTISRGISVRH